MMKRRDDLLDGNSPKGLEVWQLSTRTDVPSTHVYMEAQVFTPDSGKVIFHESAHPHGSDKDDPRHRYVLCDLKDNGRHLPLTEELGVTAPSLDPAGQWLYYLVDRTELDGGWLELRKVKIDGTGRQVLKRWDTPIRGAARRISRIYPLSSMSSDGQRFAFAGFFGSGRQANDLFGLVVVDLKSLEAQVVLQAAYRFNLHPQYCRSAEHPRLIMVQENHGGATDEKGVMTVGVGGLGADIHVLNDDGSDMRDLPWGRTDYEQCQGHQCWRGRSTVMLGTVGRFRDKMPDVGGKPGPHQEWLLEGTAASGFGDLGLNAPGGRRSVVSENFPLPARLFHFSTDLAGDRLIIDYNPDQDRGTELYLADLGAPLSGGAKKWTRLIETRTSFFKNRAHPHPFLSPDGTMAFFNSDESGLLQAYMIRGLDRIPRPA